MGVGSECGPDDLSLPPYVLRLKFIIVNLLAMSLDREGLLETCPYPGSVLNAWNVRSRYVHTWRNDVAAVVLSEVAPFITRIHSDPIMIPRYMDHMCAAPAAAPAAAAAAAD